MVQEIAVTDPMRMDVSSVHMKRCFCVMVNVDHRTGYAMKFVIAMTEVMNYLIYAQSRVGTIVFGDVPKVSLNTVIVFIAL